jgi:hypothetical protein
MARQKSVGKTKPTGRRRLKKSRDIEITEEARATYLARLQKDAVFLIENARIETELKELAMNHPAIFVKFFNRFSYLSLLIRDDFEKFVSETWSNRAKEILQDYANYSRRFRVWLTRRSRMAHFESFQMGPSTRSFALTLLVDKANLPIRRKAVFRSYLMSYTLITTCGYRHYTWRRFSQPAGQSSCR